MMLITKNAFKIKKERQGKKNNHTKVSERTERGERMSGSRRIKSMMIDWNM